MNSYPNKLKDPRWQRKRLEMLERDNWTCRACYGTEDTLMVHHKLYLPDTEPWDYPNDLLITLCEPCHDQENERGVLEKSLVNLLRKNFLVNELFIIEHGFSLLKQPYEPFFLAEVIRFILSDPELQKELIIKLRRERTKV